MVSDEVFQEVKKDMIENKGFSISRIARNTREEFCDYAKEEWADDRGAALTHLWKFFNGECNSGHEEIDTKLDVLAHNVGELQTQVQQFEEKPKGEKRLDGVKR